MASRISTVIVPVKDLAAAKAVYGALLGAEPIMDEPYYVGYRVGDLDVGLDPNGHGKGMTGPLGYWEVEDIDQALGQLTGAGATVRQEASDIGGASWSRPWPTPTATSSASPSHPEAPADSRAADTTAVASSRIRSRCPVPRKLSA